MRSLFADLRKDGFIRVAQSHLKLVFLQIDFKVCCFVIELIIRRDLTDQDSSISICIYNICHVY